MGVTQGHGNHIQVSNFPHLVVLPLGGKKRVTSLAPTFVMEVLMWVSV